MELEITNETENVSVTALVEAMVLVNIEVSIWSASRKMRPEDFGDVSLPPEKLATLGSKKIFDPTRLDPFTRIRSEAYNFMRRNGIRFGSGFIIAETLLPEISDKLETLKSEFSSYREEFLASYDAGVQEWVNDPDNRHWSHIIDGSIVDQAYVANRLRFRWHALKVTPAGVSDLAGDVAELPTLLFEEVADCARELLKTTCAEGREKGLQKSLNPFRTLRNKLEGLSFVDPLAAALAEGIDVVLNDIPAEGSLGATAMEKLRRLARKLSSPSSARAFAKAIRDGVSDEGTGDADVAAQANDFIVTLPQQPQPMPTTSPLPGPSVAPKAPSPVSEPLSPVEAVKEKDGDKQTKTASKPAAAPAAPVDVPVAAPAEAPAIPLTNDDLVVLFGEETRQLAPTFNVPEDLLRKAMGL